MTEGSISNMFNDYKFADDPKELRARAAIAAMQALMTKNYCPPSRVLIESAIQYADELIAQLNKETP